MNEEEENLEKSLLAYFSVAIKTLIIDVKISNNFRKQIFGIRNSDKHLAVYLLGQLGRNDIYTKLDISGAEIMKYINGVFYRVNKLIGGRVILVEHNGKNKLTEFYNNMGFKYLQKQNQLHQMVKVIKD